MPTIRITRETTVDKQHRRQQVQQLAAKLGEELGAEYRWDGDRLVFERSGASGHIEIGADVIHVEIRLGLVLSPMKKAIEHKINAYLEDLHVDTAPANS